MVSGGLGVVVGGGLGGVGGGLGVVVGGEDVANFDNSASREKVLALVFNCWKAFPITIILKSTTNTYHFHHLSTMHILSHVPS